MIETFEEFLNEGKSLRVTKNLASKIEAKIEDILELPAYKNILEHGFVDVSDARQRSTYTFQFNFPVERAITSGYLDIFRPADTILMGKWLYDCYFVFCNGYIRHSGTYGSDIRPNVLKGPLSPTQLVSTLDEWEAHFAQLSDTVDKKYAKRVKKTTCIDICLSSDQARVDELRSKYAKTFTHPCFEILLKNRGHAKNDDTFIGELFINTVTQRMRTDKMVMDMHYNQGAEKPAIKETYEECVSGFLNEKWELINYWGHEDKKYTVEEVLVVIGTGPIPDDLKPLVHKYRGRMLVKDLGIS